MFGETRRQKPSRAVDLGPASAGALHKTSELYIYSCTK
jgi:hypothetical protein